MTILLVGCGRMGSAMARGWIDRDRVVVLDPGATPPAGVESIETAEDVISDEELIVILAVKPQVFREVAQMLAPLATRTPLIVSIMAGITLASLRDAFGGSNRIIRAMPNTAAAIGKGVSGAIAAVGADEADRHRVGSLLSVLGDVLWFEEEGDVDLVTAISGSGPAYFFRMAEALSEAGARAGLTPEVAMRLARATLIGAAALAEADKRSLAALRQEVTSPGGTTAAGLGVMDRPEGVDQLMRNVVAAAARRSAELAS